MVWQDDPSRCGRIVFIWKAQCTHANAMRSALVAVFSSGDTSPVKAMGKTREMRLDPG
jgi:hypothetical protein